MREKVKAHYYVDPKYQINSVFRSRVGAELHEIGRVGDVVVISPAMMKMNCSGLDPGAYQILEIRPNARFPEQVYDYDTYGVWTELGKTKLVIVKPIFTVSPSKFSSYEFIFKDKINAEGMLTKAVMVLNNDGLLIKETEL